MKVKLLALAIMGVFSVTNAIAADGFVCDGCISDSDIGSVQVVKDINGLKDGVTLVGGSNVTVTTDGNSLVINAQTGVDNSTKVLANTNDISAQAQTISTLQAQVAAVNSLNSANSTTIGTLQQSVSGLQAQVVALESLHSGNGSTIASLEQLITDLQEQSDYLESLHDGSNFVGELTAGTYGGGVCTLDGSALVDGRTEWFFNCISGSNNFLASFVTGDIVGHPNEPLLTNAGIDQLNGWESDSWGQVLSVDSSGFSWFNCVGTHDDLGVISIRQIGDTLNFKFYATDNVLNCGFSTSLVEAAQ